MNISKTKVMVFSKKYLPVNIRVNDNKLEKVNTFKYLGTFPDKLSEYEENKIKDRTSENNFLRHA